VQHCLVGFRGSVPNKPQLARTREEARALATSIYERALKGEDFAALVKQYTDDSFPGIYAIRNYLDPVEHPEYYPRAKVVRGFGDVAFSLAVGEVRIADYDPIHTPHGWHVIKRLE
jgi:parvulin-like peptidyl-prolyl isomerase